MKPTVEYDTWCMRCNNKSFDIQKGILCKITNKKPEFDLVCPEYDYDPFAEQKLMHEDTRYISSNRRILVRSKSYVLTAFSIAAILFLIFGKIGLAIFGIFPSILFLLGTMHYFRWVIAERGRLRNPNASKSTRGLSDILILHAGSRAIKRWTTKGDFNKLRRANSLRDYKFRTEIVSALKQSPTDEAREMLVDALNDYNFNVVKEAANSLFAIGISDAQLLERVKATFLRWEKEEKRIKDNWENSSYTKFKDKYIDKDSMVRLKDAKTLMNKFKGSMSIG